jgi:hypothetical protein
MFTTETGTIILVKTCSDDVILDFQRQNDFEHAILFSFNPMQGRPPRQSKDKPKQFTWDFASARTQAGQDVKALHDLIEGDAFESVTTKNKYIRWVSFVLLLTAPEYFISIFLRSMTY